MKKITQLFALLAAALMLCLSAPAGAQPITTSMQIMLDGMVSVPLTNGLSDVVALSGMVHVVTHGGQPSDPIRIHVNLDRVTGVGSRTGLRYIATGAGQENFPGYPPDPIRFSFDLRPLGAPSPLWPSDPMRLDISFIFMFGDFGQLSDVDIESMTVVLP